MVNEQSFNTIIPVVQGGKKRQLRVGLYTLRSSSGLVAQVTNYGAKLVSLIVPNNQGVKADVVLGFNTLDEWRTKETYFNAVIGRVANRIKDGRERAIAYHDTVAPLIEEIRYHVDHLELIVDDELWPLPKYREMLFIH